jgi:proteic killer suppression protein
MIRTFRNKGLAELWEKDESRKIDSRMHNRLRERLDALDVADEPEDMDIPGFDFHGLRGKPKRYSVHVNGPWTITFEFDNGDALKVDFEQYH